MAEQPFFFQGWGGLVHDVVVGALAYLVLIVLLRVLGKKMLLETSPASLVMTATLGNALATVALTESIGLVVAIAAFLTLMLLQFVLFWVSARSQTLHQLLRGKPTLVFYEGQFLEEMMRKHGVSEDDIYAAARQHGVAEIGEIGAIVYEIDGTMSAMKRSANGSYPGLGRVEGYLLGSGEQQRGG